MFQEDTRPHYELNNAKSSDDEEYLRKIANKVIPKLVLHDLDKSPGNDYKERHG